MAMPPSALDPRLPSFNRAQAATRIKTEEMGLSFSPHVPKAKGASGPKMGDTALWGYLLCTSTDICPLCDQLGSSSVPHAVSWLRYSEMPSTRATETCTVGGHARCMVQSPYLCSTVSPSSLALALFVQEDGLTSATFTAGAMMRDSWQPPLTVRSWSNTVYSRDRKQPFLQHGHQGYASMQKACRTATASDSY